MHFNSHDFLFKTFKILQSYTLNICAEPYQMQDSCI